MMKRKKTNMMKTMYLRQTPEHVAGLKFLQVAGSVGLVRILMKILTIKKRTVNYVNKYLRETSILKSNSSFFSSRKIIRDS